MTNWLKFYNERLRFRNMMKGITPMARKSLAFLDTTKEIQNKEGLDSKAAKQKLCRLLAVKAGGTQPPA